MPLFRADNGSLHVFVHIPKCGGTTIEEFLIQRFGQIGLIGKVGAATLQHMTWDELSKVLPINFFDSSFGVVRHPVSRFISAYNMRITQVRPPFPREVTLDDFLTWVEARLKKNPSLLDNHVRPQTDFLGNETKVFLFEDGLEKVVEYLAIEFGTSARNFELGHHHHRPASTAGMFVPAKVTQKQINRISRLYIGDLKAFGYESNPPLQDFPYVKCLRSSESKKIRRVLWKGATSLKGLLY